MITRVRVVRFKRFADQIFDLTGMTVLLAGPNNSGKTSLLHAISAWNLALRRWQAERGEEGDTRRIGLTLDEFTALSLREMNLLWTNRHTARIVNGSKQPKPIPIYVEVTVSLGQRVEESLTIEFMYANEKLVYVRPVKSPEDPQPIESLPAFARRFNVVHVPPFSGIGTQEPRHTTGIQNKLVGEGKPGDIVRNLLLDIWEASGRSKEGSPWAELAADTRRLFQCELLPPRFSEMQAYILCEYQPALSTGRRAPRAPKLDIANGGSGFHQILLLLAFFHARPSSVLLLDEPDAHLHFILQREILDLLRAVAQRRNCKLVIATHAEVLLEGSEPDQIISFVGAEPRRLATAAEKRRLQDSLRRLSALDLLQADHVGAVLYVEDESDYKILRAWAAALDHPARKFLEFPYVVPMQGRGNLDEAKRHFQCLALARPGIKGLCILDRDLFPDDQAEQFPGDLVLRRWGRYEVENYLLRPDLLKRFVRRDPDLFSHATAEMDEATIDAEIARNFPPNLDFRDNIPALRDLKASEFLVNLLAKTSAPLPKRDLYMLAKLSEPDEIHEDVRSMLDGLAAILPDRIPSIDVNVPPSDPNGTDASTDAT